MPIDELDLMLRESLDRLEVGEASPELIGSRARSGRRRRRVALGAGAAALAAAAIVLVVALAPSNHVLGPPTVEADISVTLPGRVVDAAAGDGGLWVLTCPPGKCGYDQGTPRGDLVEVDESTGKIERTVPVREPQALAVGAGGVWMIEPRADEVLRLDPDSGRTVARIHLRLPRPIAGQRYFLPFALTVGAGSVWVSTERGYVAQIDPATNKVERMISTHGLPAGQMTVAGGSVWLAAQLAGMLRIDPATGALHRTGSIDGKGGVRLSVNEVRGARGTLWLSGSWAVPSDGANGAGDGNGRPASFVAAGSNALVVANPKTGAVEHLTALPDELAIKAVDPHRAWLAEWSDAEDVYLAHASGGAPHLVARLDDPGTIVAADGRALWVARPFRTLERFLVP